jgi:membrane dipeptidase
MASIFIQRTTTVTKDLFLSILLSGLTLSASAEAQTEDDALEHAREILRTTPLIDGHNDLPWTIREYAEAPRDVEAYDIRQARSGDTDLPRLKAGQVAAQFWSVWVPGEITEGYAKVQLEQIDIARRMIARYPEGLVLALTAADIEAAFQSGRVASLLGMEGGHVIENSLGALRAYYALGARYMTLTHNVTLDWADAALDEPQHNGLTWFGKEVVREMNRLGMLVDLSHVTPKVMNDVLDVSEAPVIFSHSSARGLMDHPRNVPDSILARMPENGGVVMVNFVPGFISQEVADWEAPLQDKLAGIHSSQEYDRIRREYAVEHPMPRAKLSQVADHIEHVRKVAGIDHVAIGSDFWGGEDMPVGLEDVSRFPYLFAELIRQGWSDPDLRKLAGENTLRVIRVAEATARRIQATRPPSTATIEELDGATSDVPAIPFDSDRWDIEAEEFRVEDYLGQKSLYLKGGSALIKDTDFTNGIIEFDIAFTGERGFMGAVWRVQDERNYEDFYIRPHQSGKPDANQYTPVFNGVSGWQLYHGEGYGAPVEYKLNAWIHVRIVVSGGRGEVYIDRSVEPVLFMHELKREVGAGQVGLKAGFAPARFANFSYQNTDRPTLRGKPQDTEPAPPGTVMSWSVSGTLDEKSLEGKHQLSGADKDNLTWVSLESESTGLANLARVQGIEGEGKNTVFAKVVIVSEREQIKKLKLGFSDRVKVYLNDRLLYGGNNLYRSRDYRFLGTIGLFDEIYLPLKQGRNELWLAVSESFGGWGIKALFEDMDGIEIEN